MPTNVPPYSGNTGKVKDYRKKGSGLESNIKSADRMVRDPLVVHSSFPSGECRWFEQVAGPCCDPEDQETL